MIRSYFDLAVLTLLVLVALYESPLVLALVAVIPGSVLGFLVLRHTREMDANARKVAVEAAKTTTRRDTIGELDTIIDNLQEELKRAYSRVDSLEQRIETLERRIVQLERGRA